MRRSRRPFTWDSAGYDTLEARMREFTGDALCDRCMESVLSYDPLAVLQPYKQTAARLREEYVSTFSSALSACARGTRTVERTPAGVRNLAVTCFQTLMEKNPRCRRLQEEAEFEKDTVQSSGTSHHLTSGTAQGRTGRVRRSGSGTGDLTQGKP